MLRGVAFRIAKGKGLLGFTDVAEKPVRMSLILAGALDRRVQGFAYWVLGTGHRTGLQ